MIKKEVYGFNPDYAIHPGEYIEEILEAREIKEEELSSRLNISIEYLNQILGKQTMLTPEIIAKLEKTLGISANIWNNLNADFLLSSEKQQKRSQSSSWFEWIKYLKNPKDMKV